MRFGSKVLQRAAKQGPYESSSSISLCPSSPFPPHASTRGRRHNPSKGGTYICTCGLGIRAHSCTEKLLPLNGRTRRTMLELSEEQSLQEEAKLESRIIGGHDIRLTKARLSNTATRPKRQVAPTREISAMSGVLSLGEC